MRHVHTITRDRTRQGQCQEANGSKCKELWVACFNPGAERSDWLHISSWRYEMSKRSVLKNMEIPWRNRRRGVYEQPNKLKWVATEHPWEWNGKLGWNKLGLECKRVVNAMQIAWLLFCRKERDRETLNVKGEACGPFQVSRRGSDKVGHWGWRGRKSLLECAWWPCGHLCRNGRKDR